MPKRFKCHCIPCLFLPNESGSSKLLLYFHGNAEDIGCTLDFLDELRNQLKIHVLAVEYPGYGIYKGNSNEKTIITDAEHVINFILKFSKWKEENIIIFGRSIGSGPATYLAARYKIKCLILMSPFTSIKDVVAEHVGLLKILLAERFRNIDNMRLVKSPIFIIHGKKDKLVPFIHSFNLVKECKAPYKLVNPEEMTHNYFDFLTDFLIPLKDFLFKIEIVCIGNEPFLLPIESFYEPY